VPLAATLRQAHPEVVQAWYADDGQLQGRSPRVAAAMIFLQRLGPERGYFPEPAKSIFVCNPEDRPGPRSDSKPSASSLSTVVDTSAASSAPRRPSPSALSPRLHNGSGASSRSRR
jgi:hypothetical protein